MGPAAKGRSRASKEGKVRIFTTARKVLVDKNPATFDVDPDAYDTSDLLWDGSFDDPTGNPPSLSQYTAESGFVIGNGKLLGNCLIEVDTSANKCILTINAVSDIDPLVWVGEKSGTAMNGSYNRLGGTDQTPTLEIGDW